ncbi:8-amino-7-oxononanoate synthase [compost metagenome]
MLASLEIIGGTEGAERRAHLQTLIAQWRSALQLQRWQALPSDTAIQPVVIGANEEAMKIAAALYEQNIWVPAIRPPTVPAGTARLRVTLSAAHTAAEVTQLVEVLQQLERQV